MKNEHDAEDVTQNACMKAWMYLDKFRGVSAFSTWLTRIAINESYNYMEKQRRVPPMDTLGEEMRLLEKEVTSSGYTKYHAPDSGHDDTVDALVTEYGIAVNPERDDLHDALRHTDLNLVDIEDLKNLAYSRAGITRRKEPDWGDDLAALVEYRDGTIIDVVPQLST